MSDYLSNEKRKNIYTQPKPANEQAQMRRNTLCVLIEQSKEQKQTHPAKGRAMNKQKYRQTLKERLLNKNSGKRKKEWLLSNHKHKYVLNQPNTGQ